MTDWWILLRLETRSIVAKTLKFASLHSLSQFFYLSQLRCFLQYRFLLLPHDHLHEVIAFIDFFCHAYHKRAGSFIRWHEETCASSCFGVPRCPTEASQASGRNEVKESRIWKNRGKTLRQIASQIAKHSTPRGIRPWGISQVVCKAYRQSIFSTTTMKC